MSKPDVREILPDCMMTDGADPCDGYKQAASALEQALEEIERLHKQLVQYSVEATGSNIVVVNDHIASLTRERDDLMTKNARLKGLLREILEYFDNNLKENGGGEYRLTTSDAFERARQVLDAEGNADE